MIRFEALALAISKINGGLDDPDSKAFKLRNPGMLKTYRPEKKTDSDHYRIFTSSMGGFKALVADLQAKCSGKNHRLSVENTLGDMLRIFGFESSVAQRKIVLFVQRALQDESVTIHTKLSWFSESPIPVQIQKEEVEVSQES